MTWLPYYLLMYGMRFGIEISSLWNDKAAKWVEGRRDWKQKLQNIGKKKSKRIWFHVSSLGEFEQARPVIERLKSGDPSIQIILTFFSPSGYEIRKNYPFAEVYYLPPDLPGNAGTWLELVKPDLAVFVKYDLWPGYLKALIQHRIPFILISAHYRPGLLTSWSTSKHLLKKANRIFLQNDQYSDHLKNLGFTNLEVAGDTRIDRTTTLPDEAKDRIPALLKNEKPFDLIAGSTWAEDEALLIPIIQKLKLRAIIAPHDVSEKNVNRLFETISSPAVRLSALTADDKDKIIVVDSIGMLAYLYALGKIAYIGGGFGKSIHNILEPAAHGLPVIFGPKHLKFPEAQSLISLSAAKAVRDETELEEAFLFFQNNLEVSGQAAKDFIEKNKGATDAVCRYIQESIPFATKL